MRGYPEVPVCGPVEMIPFLLNYDVSEEHFQQGETILEVHLQKSIK